MGFEAEGRVTQRDLGDFNAKARRGGLGIGMLVWYR